MLTRRQFLKTSAILFQGYALGWLGRHLGMTAPVVAASSLPSSLTSPSHGPSLAQAAPKPRVMHIQDSSATYWTGSGSFYQAVRQGAVSNMVRVGLQRLTGAGTWSGVWDVLFRRVRPDGYSPGQKIAIKVNFNNTGRDGNGCSSHSNVIDALPHPVIGLLDGLAAAGVQASDIVIFDATGSGRIIPDYFRDPIVAQYPGVQFVGNGSTCSGVRAAGHGKDPSLTVHFDDPQGVLSDRLLADVLYDASYLINIPILKCHGGNSFIPVSLSFKNHFGSLNNIIRGGNDDLHEFLSTSGSQFRTTYSPLVDIYSNPNIAGKTILTMGDGLFGAFGAVSTVPLSWKSFGGAPNSLFLATDPVALDCVMIDHFVAEGRITTPNAYSYLFCAREAGLGMCEGTRDQPGGDPWQHPFGSGYTSLEYVRLTLTGPTFADVPFDHPFHDDIEALYQAGYTAGCNTDPLLYCPEQAMTRAESAVFVQRGAHGVDVQPGQPASQTFADLPLESWASRWAEALYADGYTAGCWTDPLRYCPWQGHTRAEGAVFYLRMLHGQDYSPPDPEGIFSDVPAEAWYARWAEAAYQAGLIPACGEVPLRFCPDDPLTRGLAAFMMVQAKGLLLP